VLSGRSDKRALDYWDTQECIGLPVGSVDDDEDDNDGYGYDCDKVENGPVLTFDVQNLEMTMKKILCW